MMAGERMMRPDAAAVDVYAEEISFRLDYSHDDLWVLFGGRSQLGVRLRMRRL